MWEECGDEKMEARGERIKVGCGEEAEAACCCGYEGEREMETQTQT